jgi:hypothetical protein
MSRLYYAAPRRAGNAAIAAREQRLPAEAGGDSGGAKMPLVFPIRSGLTNSIL